MHGAVGKFQHEHPASSTPRPVCLPDVGVLVGGRVVTQTAAARVDRFVNRAARFACVADDGSRDRIA